MRRQQAPPRSRVLQEPASSYLPQAKRSFLPKPTVRRLARNNGQLCGKFRISPSFRYQLKEARRDANGQSTRSIVRSAANDGAAGDVCEHDAITTIAAAAFDDDAAWGDLGDMSVAQAARPCLANGLDRRADARTMGIIANILDCRAERRGRRGR